MSKGGYHAWVTMLDNGFIVEAYPEDTEGGVYNLFSTILESMDEEESMESVEEPGDNSQVFMERQDAVVTMEMLKKRKRG